MPKFVESLSPADRALYDDYYRRPRAYNSDALLRLAAQAESPELRQYLTDESWYVFRCEEARAFDS